MRLVWTQPFSTLIQEIIEVTDWREEKSTSFRRSLGERSDQEIASPRAAVASAKKAQHDRRRIPAEFVEESDAETERCRLISTFFIF